MLRQTVVRVSRLTPVASSFTPSVFVSNASQRVFLSSVIKSPIRLSPLVRYGRLDGSIPQAGVKIHVKAFSTTFKAAAISTRDTKVEKEAREQKLRSDPESVSSTSTVVPIFGGAGKHAPPEGSDVDMLAGLKSDLRVVRDTFRLSDVPREVLYIGMAGVIPYVVTSFSTLYLAWELNYAHSNGIGYLISKETAESLLHVLEPTQIGYGAVILSFLGAIHWGLEFAGYGGRKSVRRYAIGLLAPALAWPTILLPLHQALLCQFIGFTGMYFFDTSAAQAGLAPPWYNTYRFVLTFVVGASVVLTLIGRGQIGDQFQHVPSPTQHLADIRAEQRRNRQKELEERLREAQLADAKEHQANSPPTKTDEQDEASEGDGSARGVNSQNKEPTGGKRAGGVHPGDENEPVREEMRAKPIGRPQVPQGPEGAEKKANVNPAPEGK